MPLPKLKDIKWVTTDCYGTLIDWEKGITDGFAAEAKRDGFSFDEGPFIARFFEIQAEHAPNLLIGFGRLNGRPVGVVANQPAHLAGCLDISASLKAAREQSKAEYLKRPDPARILAETAAQVDHALKLLW